MSATSVEAVQAAEQAPVDALDFVQQAVVGPPRVNLLPPAILERRALRKLQAGLAAVAAGCAVAVGGLYAQAGSGKAAAQQSLDAANAQHSTLQQQLNDLAPVRATEQRVEAARQALSTAMGSQVLWSHYLDQVRARLADGVRLSALTVTPTANAPGASTAKGGSTAPSSASGSTSGSLTVPNAVATVTLTGKAVDHDAIASELDQLSGIDGFDGVYLTTTSADSSGDAVLSFTIVASVTPAAITHTDLGSGGD